MKTAIYFIITLCVLTLYAGTSKAQVNYVYLSGAKMVFFTPSSSPYGNDNKDHDTQIDVSIIGAYGYVSSATHNGQDIEYPDNNSNNEMGLNLSDPNGRQYIAMPEFSHGRYVITITPNGNDEWIFKPTLYLYFSNGTSAVYTANNFLKLNQNNRTGTVTF
jgi:hypothetical protein